MYVQRVLKLNLMILSFVLLYYTFIKLIWSMSRFFMLVRFDGVPHSVIIRVGWGTPSVGRVNGKWACNNTRI